MPARVANWVWRWLTLSVGAVVFIESAAVD
jgi:hypothetical protein